MSDSEPINLEEEHDFDENVTTFVNTAPPLSDIDNMDPLDALDPAMETGSMDNLDTIALTTSPTMESLDLGDNKSLDSIKLDTSQYPDDEEPDEDGGINIKIGSDNETETDNETNNANSNNTSHDVQNAEASTEYVSHIPDIGESEDPEPEIVKQDDSEEQSVSEITETLSTFDIQGAEVKPEPNICDYFGNANDDNTGFFDAIVPDATGGETDTENLLENLDNETEQIVTPSEPISINETESDDVQKTRSGSTLVETPSCSFEGESSLQDKIGSVSDLLMESNKAEKSEKEEFFEHFTAEGAPGQPAQDDFKDKRKPLISYVMPHLSPGPSPNTSTYASPIRQVSSPLNPLSIPTDIPLGTSPLASHAFPEDLTGTSPYGTATIAQELMEDPFSASLKMSEADRQRDSWIASDLTRQILMSMVTNAPGTYYPRLDQLTRPGVLLDERQGDPVVELMYKCMSEHEVMKRRTLSADMVSQDEDGLRKLIRAECYRSALDLTSKLLTLHGQGMGKLNDESKNSAETLQLWLTRIAMLMKLKLYQVAESELTPFSNFDKPDMYYEFYRDVYPGRKGSMVPFSLRILHAELPHFLCRSQDSLDRLYYIHAIIRKILSNLDSGLSEEGSVVELTSENRAASRDVWENREVRVLYSIVTVLIGAKVYDSAVELMETLIMKDSSNKIPLISALGRLYLQMGDIPSARVQFDVLETLLDHSDEIALSKLHMNRGFIALGMNEFELAKKCFQMVVELDPGNGVAVNNMAVCCLYTGKLKEALHVLESLVQANPARYLQDGILINLCTLYELESSRAIHKKQQLLNLVAEYKGNGFTVSCLKMGELMMKK